MAAKCAYVEKVGAVYYVRKRLPRAWQGRVAGTVLRLSLGTRDRASRKWPRADEPPQLLHVLMCGSRQHIPSRQVDQDHVVASDLARQGLQNVPGRALDHSRVV
ncbi:DUF6538 domain-containing protein [Devosia sp. 67-54]